MKDLVKVNIINS